MADSTSSSCSDSSSSSNNSSSSSLRDLTQSATVGVGTDSSTLQFAGELRVAVRSEQLEASQLERIVRYGSTESVAEVRPVCYTLSGRLREICPAAVYENHVCGDAQARRPVSLSDGVSLHGLRVYKSVIQAVQKSDEGHPFRSLLERDISVSLESAQLLTDQSLIHLNWFSSQARRLLLVEDLVDSLKMCFYFLVQLAAVMWMMTYVGAIFNGVTILILADITFFTTPLIYQKKKVQIDRYIELIKSRVEETLQK
ncbi:uncharacterized protein LOC142939525 [Anarhichas minor]|uniref:uncharacterized protein LOC142939525 n=1 Tax=Anarhichas minor TaxID=65739 RepID=UPI003F73C562